MIFLSKFFFRVIPIKHVSKELRNILVVIKHVLQVYFTIRTTFCHSLLLFVREDPCLAVITSDKLLIFTPAIMIFECMFSTFRETSNPLMVKIFASMCWISIFRNVISTFTCFFLFLF